MYFSYQNNLGFTHSAYLYDYVMQHKDRLGEVYEAYRPQVEHFVLLQIQKGRINRHLASLYNQVLKPDMINEQNGSMVSRMLFAHMIHVEDDRLKKVYVFHHGNHIPEEDMLVDGKAWVSFYGNNYTLVFEDAWKNRFVKNVEYTTERLMMSSKYLAWVLPYACDNIGLDFYMCDSDRTEREAVENNMARALRVVAYPGTDEKLKKELYVRILQYYYDRDDIKALNACFEAVEKLELSA